MSDSNKILLTTFVGNDPVLEREYSIWSHLVHKSITNPKIKVKTYIEEGLTLDQNSEFSVVRSKTLLPESPHCNKIIPLLDPSNHDYDGVIITDTDLYMVEDVTTYFSEDRIRTAPNNGNNPPIDIYETLFKEFGIESKVRPGVSLMAKEGKSRESYVNNNSGGIIMIPRKWIKPFGELWLEWAKKLLQKRHLLDKWSIHVDQVAFALAMETIGEDIDFLAPQTNTILPLLPYVNHVQAFHIAKAHKKQYAKWFDDNGFLTYPTDNEHLLSAIQKLNSAISAVGVDKSMENRKSPPTGLLSKLFNKK